MPRNLPGQGCGGPNATEASTSLENKIAAMSQLHELMQASLMPSGTLALEPKTINLPLLL
jgi:hypothetical protein